MSSGCRRRTEGRCHRPGTAIVTQGCGAKPSWWRGAEGPASGARGDNVPVEAAVTDGDKRPRCSRRGLNAFSVPRQWVGAGWLGVAAGTQGRPRGAGQCPAAAPRPPASRSHSCPVPPSQAGDPGLRPGDAVNTAVQRGSFGKAGICGELPGKSLFHVGAASAPPPRAARSPGSLVSTGEQRHGPAPAVQERKR